MYLCRKKNRSNCQSVFVIRFDHEIKHPILNTYNELQYAKKNHNRTFKVNFLCLKINNFSNFFHLRILIINFKNSDFCKLLRLPISPILKIPLGMLILRQSFL